MAHITIEYMIMIPVLIMQIFLFPIAASVIMNTWGDSNTTIQLQTTSGHMGSSIQQLYHTISHGSMSDGSMKITLDVPPIINGRAYTTTLSHLTHSDTSYQIMNVTLNIIGSKVQSSTLITLGENVDWDENLAFNSTSHNLSLIATKTANSILITYGGN